MSGRPFPAKYRGRCAADCDEPRVEPGDLCVMTDGGELVHQRCDDDPGGPKDHGPRCAECFTYHRGECL